MDMCVLGFGLCTVYICAFVFQAKGKERQWLKNQAVGELDDAKIIDGLTGEKAIYKRRGELEPEVGMWDTSKNTHSPYIPVVCEIIIMPCVSAQYHTHFLVTSSAAMYT